VTVATGVGSMPGSDDAAYVEAVRTVLGELPDLPHLPELPGRGTAATMIGRALAIVSELGADLQPAGWRLTDAPGVDQRRARSLLAQDLDRLEEQAQGYDGAFKVQVAGPWTLAATVEKPRGDKVLSDVGARRELAQALAEGLGDHVADARRRLGSTRHQRPRLAYRDVASATNRLTLIAAVLPAGCVSTHTVFCLRTPLRLRDQHFLCGLFNSLVVNYLVRLRVTTHVTTGTVEQLPIPATDAAPAAAREIAGLARLLAGRPNAAAFARLNARVAALYQLSAAEFEHILGTFPLIAAEERHAALNVFRFEH